MFGVSDLYSPVLSEKENKSVLESLTKGAVVTATYRHTTREFHWFATMDGVATIFAPGYTYTTKDDYRSYILIPEPDNRFVMGADIPVTLDGDYVLAELDVRLNPSLSQQPGYLEAIKNLPKKDQRNPIYSSFRYLVSLDNTRKENPLNERQGCLSVITPFGYPDTSIPVVTLVGTKLTEARLTHIINQPCPLTNVKINEKSLVSTGHLPPARIAAAQASLDYFTTKGVDKKWGSLPVTKEMTRWYQRNDEGVYASLKKFGPFELFSMRVRWDATYPEGKRLPIRTETWYFYNKKLVKYSGSIYYKSTDDKNYYPSTDDTMSAEEVIYFHNGKKVFNESEQDNCHAQSCQNALADIKKHSANSWGDLQGEAMRYMELPLIPVNDGIRLDKNDK